MNAPDLSYDGVKISMLLSHHAVYAVGYVTLVGIVASSVMWRHLVDAVTFTLWCCVVIILAS